MSFKAIIFDMGGVLVRTVEQAPRDQLADSLGISRMELTKAVFDSPTAHMAENGQISEEMHWNTVLDSWNIPGTARRHFIETFWAGDRLDENLIGFLRKLHSHYKTGLLSNAWDGVRNAVQSRYGFLDEFDVSIFSAEVKVRKPAREAFQLMVDRLDVDPTEAIFIDDFLLNIDGARQAGLTAVHFTDSVKAIKDIESLLQPDFI